MRTRTGGSRLLCAAVAFVTLSLAPVRSQEPSRSTSAGERMASWERHLALAQSSPFAGMKWRTVGPSFMGGRLQSIALDPRRPGAFYVGVGSGNLWHTVNNGTTWTPIFEGESTFTIGDVAVSPSNPDVIWVGTGEVLMARSSFAGTGVFRSTDRGKTWQHKGLADTHHIGKVLIDPKDPDTVYVAAIGHNFSANAERGLFKTTDGGTTWTRVLYLSDHTGVVDLLMDRADSRTLWAVSWDRDRTRWNNRVSGTESGVHKTTDGGRTWTRVRGGLPEGEHVGRIGLAVAASNPSVMYALVDNRAPVPPVPSGARRSREPDVVGGELYRSDDRGATWRKANAGPIGTAIGYDFCIVQVAPDNPEEVYVLGNYLKRSRDGGRTWETLDGQGAVVHLRPHGGKMLHLDHHALVIDPANTDRLLLGTDGGLYVSEDRGSTWLHVNNLPIGEFYAISVDDADPYRIYGGTQDDAALYGTATALRDDEPEDWAHVYLDPWAGGDSYFTLVDPTDPDVVYFEHQFGDLRRKNLKTGATADIQPAAPDGEPPLRFNWMTPFVVSSHSPSTLYFGANRLLRSSDRGDRWSAISPDLTTCPGPDRRGNVPYGTITTISESPLKPGLIVVGTDDGRVSVTTDEGATWRDVSAGLPSKWVSRVVASAYDPGTVYVSLTGYREDDFATYLFASTDLGRTWRSIGGNLPAEAVNVVREDPANRDLLYAGTDLGVYVSLDKGASWRSLRANLPTCAVHDLVVHSREHELVIGTHGRGVFVLDARPVQALSARVIESAVHVFDVRPVTIRRHPEDSEPARQGTRGEAVIHYWLKAPGEVTVTVRDPANRVARTSRMAGRAGVNAVTWGLERGGPGVYRVEVASGGHNASATVRVNPFAAR